ncbi:MAG: SIMPL domain-containing protein [Chloroflexi bacterium]|nr:SIMPL domain-containing protein [Chloroflexota bacterium]
MTFTHIFQGIRGPAALMLVLLAIAVIATAACAANEDDAESDDDNGATVILDRSTDGIWVTGAGRVSVTPDIATLRIGVETSGETVGAAMSEAASSMHAVVDSLTASGISEDDIQTLTFNVSTQYEWNDTLRRSEMVGFTVTNTVRATVRALDTIADVIDGAVNAGGDNARVDGLSFDIDDRIEAEREARELAMHIALSHATQLASLAEVELGEPFYVSESGAAPLSQDTPEMMRTTSAFADDEMASTPILAGENEVVIHVRVGYAIV